MPTKKKVSRRTSGRRRLPRLNVPLTLDAKTINMLVARGKIWDATQREWCMWTTSEKMGAMEVLDNSSQAIGERIILLWKHQYPVSMYILPAVRPAKDFD